MSEKTTRECGRCGADLSGGYKHECNPPKDEPAQDTIEEPLSAAGDPINTKYHVKSSISKSPEEEYEDPQK